MDLSIDDDLSDLHDPDFLERSTEEEAEVSNSHHHVRHLSPREVLSRLERGWMNEKLAPELLPPLEGEKDAMLRQIKVMERNVASLDKKDMRTDIHKLELERIKFVVASYMRARLFKLQGLGIHYYEEEVKRPPGRPSTLIREEFAFLKSLMARTEEYVRNTLLSKMPLLVQRYELKKFRRRPQLDAHIFFRVVQPQRIDVEDAFQEIHPVSLGEGEQHMMRYLPVARLLGNEGIYLV